MGRSHRWFDKEFAAEAIRLVETSGRSQKDIADDLVIGRSTLRNWLIKHREQEPEAPPPDRQEDIAAELKRFRRENEIPKRAVTFLPRTG